MAAVRKLLRSPNLARLEDKCEELQKKCLLAPSKNSKKEAKDRAKKAEKIVKKKRK